MKKKICAGGFLMKEDKFLFGKRSGTKSWAPGVWDTIGGHAFKNEDVFEALKRESLEEIGIVVHSADLLSVMDVWDKSKNNFFSYYIYMITLWEGEPRNISDEHTEIAWFTRSQLDTISLALQEYPDLIDKWINNTAK
ncbi:MAG: NUDIX hydrolase [Ferruginibacter sp.]